MASGSAKPSLHMQIDDVVIERMLASLLYPYNKILLFDWRSSEIASFPAMTRAEAVRIASYKITDGRNKSFVTFSLFDMTNRCLL
jgi:hypothetical protein